MGRGDLIMAAIRHKWAKSPEERQQKYKNEYREMRAKIKKHWK